MMHFVFLWLAGTFFLSLSFALFQILNLPYIIKNYHVILILFIALVTTYRFLSSKGKHQTRRNLVSRQLYYDMLLCSSVGIISALMARLHVPFGYFAHSWLLPVTTNQPALRIIEYGYVDLTFSNAAKTYCSIEEQSYEDGWEVDYVSGAALAIKREVIEKIGLLDPRFYAYMEEVDWCYRAKKAGYKVVVSDAVIYHYGSASWQRFPLRKFYLNYRNRILFISKHYPKMMLLKYFLEYPVRFTAESLLNFLRKKTAIQRISPKNQSKIVLQKLLKIYLTNIFFFYLTIIPGLRLCSSRKTLTTLG